MRFSFPATIFPALLNSFKPCGRQSLKSTARLDEANHLGGGYLHQRGPSAAKSTIPRRGLAPRDGGTLDAARPWASNPASPMSCVIREAGLAAVATELDLQVGTLEREVAEAVERGAAALFFAGFGPRLTKAGQTVGVGEQPALSRQLVVTAARAGQ